MRPAGVVMASVIVAACSDPSADHARAIDRHLPSPAERAAAPPSSAERMFVPAVPADATPADTAPADTAPAPIHRNAQLATVWSGVTRTGGCFFFSGPDGRDDPLTGPARIDRNGDAVSITIGAALFIGTFVDGALHATRKSQHDSFGAWQVTEILDGHYRDGTMTAAYRYTECGPSGPCPGRCTITAELRFER